MELVDFGLVSDSLEFMVRVCFSILIGSRECSNIRINISIIPFRKDITHTCLIRSFYVVQKVFLLLHQDETEIL